MCLRLRAHMRECIGYRLALHEAHRRYNKMANDKSLDRIWIGIRKSYASRDRASHRKEKIPTEVAGTWFKRQHVPRPPT